jgi:serine/threonine-protein kinase RsbW
VKRVTEPVVKLTFPAKADYLLLARLALAGLARSIPLDPEVLADLKLAVTEACGNAVRHAYRDGDGPVSVAFVTGEDRLVMIVEDEGAGLTTADVDGLVGEKRPEGGMGMAIIRAIVDELDVQDRSDGRGTVVRMTKFLESR